MAQSNRHWPSMFKSKPCTTHHHQWQHDINSSLISNSCTKTPYSSVGEERSPEPKPRWNPKPEQIRILEGIFNSGMVNPPRDEIRRIRAQLQEYGQVGDANVFYWFQNRKSRSKHKNRHLHTAKTSPQTQAAPSPPATSAIPASSSSSSEKSSPRPDKGLALGGTKVMEVSNSPTQSVNQTYFASARREFPLETPFLFQVQEVGVAPPLSHSYCFSELSNVVQMPEGGMGNCTGLFHELMTHQEVGKKESEEKMKMPDHQSFANLTSLAAAGGASTSITPAVSNSIIHEIQGFASGTIAESGSLVPSVAARSTVFINDVAFEVSVGPFSVREAFGDDAVLLHSSGQPVLTNEWGVTIHPLHHGAFYYLV